MTWKEMLHNSNNKAIHGDTCYNPSTGEVEAGALPSEAGEPYAHPHSPSSRDYLPLFHKATKFVLAFRVNKKALFQRSERLVPTHWF